MLEGLLLGTDGRWYIDESFFISPSSSMPRDNKNSISFLVFSSVSRFYRFSRFSGFLVLSVCFSFFRFFCFSRIFFSVFSSGEMLS